MTSTGCNPSGRELLEVLFEADASLDQLALKLDKEPSTLLEEIAILEVKAG